MLVLTRNKGQRIFINEQEIIISILGVDRGQVRLGISAPKTYTILREEVWDRCQLENINQNTHEKRGNE